MQTLRHCLLNPFLVRVLAVATIGVAYRVLYCYATGRCEAKMILEYSARFEQQTAVANLVHPCLVRFIDSSKAAIDRAKQKQGDGLEALGALTEISELLKEAQENCNRALRALEQSLETGYRKDQEVHFENVARGEYVH